MKNVIEKVNFFTPRCGGDESGGGAWRLRRRAGTEHAHFFLALLQSLRVDSGSVQTCVNSWKKFWYLGN